MGNDLFEDHDISMDSAAAGVGAFGFSDCTEYSTGFCLGWRHMIETLYFLRMFILNLKYPEHAKHIDSSILPCRKAPERGCVP